MTLGVNRGMEGSGPVDINEAEKIETDSVSQMEVSRVFPQDIERREKEAVAMHEMEEHYGPKLWMYAYQHALVVLEFVAICIGGLAVLYFQNNLLMCLLMYSIAFLMAIVFCAITAWNMGKLSDSLKEDTGFELRQRQVWPVIAVFALILPLFGGVLVLHSNIVGMAYPPVLAGLGKLFNISADHPVAIAMADYFLRVSFSFQLFFPLFLGSFFIVHCVLLGIYSLMRKDCHRNGSSLLCGIPITLCLMTSFGWTLLILSRTSPRQINVPVTRRSYEIIQEMFTTVGRKSSLFELVTIFCFGLILILLFGLRFGLLRYFRRNISKRSTRRNIGAYIISYVGVLILLVILEGAYFYLYRSISLLSILQDSEMTAKINAMGR